MRDVKLILEQLDSWKTGYLPPSAMILMDEAAKVIRDQQEAVEALSNVVADLTSSLVDAKNAKPEPAPVAKPKPKPRTRAKVTKP